ncbi:MAG: Ldh family oxidoreductase, partial [Clostridia bacterium]
GSNPIAIAMPADPIKFSFDAATTVVPRGKLEVYNKKEQPLPMGWAVDADGKETSCASDVLYNIIHKVGGGILPLGGSQVINGSHKGYGFGMMTEIFTSIFAGGATSNHCVNGGNAETSQGFIAIDYGMFGNKEEIRAHFSAFLQELRDSDKAEGETRIYTHGEREVDSTREKLANGVPVNEKTDAEMRMIAETLNLDYDKYFA